MFQLKTASLLLSFVPLIACHGGGMYYTINGIVHPGSVHYPPYMHLED